MDNNTKVLDLKSLKVGQKLKIYSSDIDMYGNEVIDIFLLTKERDGIYISYGKKTGFEDDKKIEFKALVKELGVPLADYPPLSDMSLSEKELELIRKQTSEIYQRDLIKKNHPIIGQFINGLTFKYNNIIDVEID